MYFDRHIQQYTFYSTIHFGGVLFVNRNIFLLVVFFLQFIKIPDTVCMAGYILVKMSLHTYLFITFLFALLPMAIGIVEVERSAMNIITTLYFSEIIRGTFDAALQKTTSTRISLCRFSPTDFVAFLRCTDAIQFYSKRNRTIKSTIHSKSNDFRILKSIIFLRVHRNNCAKFNMLC